MQPSYHWFQQLDQLRRAQGRVLDQLGLGPQETPFSTVGTQPGLRLRCYRQGAANRPPLLIVPAPIKQPYIWDLSRDSSVVRRALEHQLDVYMLEWLEPEPGLNGPGLADYAGSMLDNCIAAIRARSGSEQVFLAGHSLGGIFAALHSAYRPGQVAGLVLVDVPLHSADVPGMGKGIERGDPGRQGTLPGSLLGMASARAKPGPMCAERYLDCLASLRSREQTLKHWRVERWTLDELAMSRSLFDDVINHLHRHNRFMRGELEIGGVRLHPANLTAPLFNIYHPAGGIVPEQSALAFHRAAGSANKELLRYTGDIGVALQHVGPLVGSNAHRHIWPRVFASLNRLASSREVQPSAAAAGPASA